MIPRSEELQPPARLALAYAPGQVRASWELTLRFDARFAAIVGATSESLIGQIKLAWWRDAIRAAPSVRPKGEPLLAELSERNDPVLDTMAASLVDAWEILIAAEEWMAPSVERFAEGRGAAVFSAYIRLCGSDDFPVLLAKQWALDDLKLRFGSRVPAIAHEIANPPLHRTHRPLSILAMSVRDVSGPRLIWNALTGR